MARRDGLEPPTLGLKARCSFAELPAYGGGGRSITYDQRVGSSVRSYATPPYTDNVFIVRKQKRAGHSGSRRR
jgi:hypothetical protein